MILRRLTHNLRTQNWTAITIELFIVIIGVFIGTQVSNWNAGRLEKRETQRMLAQLGPNLQTLTDYFASARTYYGTTRRYAATAIAGWSGDPKVSDRDFVIAAYQASQIIGIGTNNTSWATVLGADQLRNIEDPATRNDLSFLMSADYSNLDIVAVDTPYRRNVRRLIPVEIQETIRAQCGDRPLPGKLLFVYLPAKCNIQLDPAKAAEVAAQLRAQSPVLQDLYWHIAAQAALLANIPPFEITVNNLQKRIRADGEL